MHSLADMKVDSGTMAVHWFGQNSYALKASTGVIMLVDPYFPHDRPAEQFIHNRPPLYEAELPVDIVVMTHDHSDHTHPETLKRIAAEHADSVFIGPVESKRHVPEIGITPDRFIVMKPGEARTMRGVEIHALLSKPIDGDPVSGIAAPKVTHLGYVIAADGVRIYNSGDSINTIADIDDLVRPIRDLSPQIGFITTHPTEGEFPFLEGGVLLAERCGLKIAFPSHYQCFVKRTFDPQLWKQQFSKSPVEARVVGYNETVVVPS